MHNRRSSPPILLTAALAFVVTPLLSSAEPGVPSAYLDSSSPSVPPSPAPPAKPTVAATAPVSSSDPTPAAEATTTYTVVADDTPWIISQKLNCSVKKLQKLNNLKRHAQLRPGQILKIPATTDQAPAASALAAAAKPKATAPAPKAPVHHNTAYAQAQPVQDFDVPASTFASCPVPIVSDPEPEVQVASPASLKPTSAPVAKLVSPEELTADKASAKATAIPVKPVLAATPAPASKKTAAASQPAPNGLVATPFSVHDTADAATDADVSHASPSFTAFSSKQTTRGAIPPPTPPSSDWGARFLQEARALAQKGIEYDEGWRPPGETHSWAMDCSNTARYLYKVTAGIILPRTASDQYYYLHLQNKAWDVPQVASGFADCNYLRQNLKPGDLLFWENTYRPERQPPITHVMVFLGSNDKGDWIMAGSQSSRGGEHNRRNGGPDIYVFNPTKPCGGYTTWLGFVHHQGRFCAYGRPLEADQSKLSMATND